MKLNTSARAALVALLCATAAPALAQYAPPPPSNQPAAADPGQSEPQKPRITISAKAAKPLAALQAAVNANDTANIPARLAAAQAAAQTKEDRFVIAQLQLKAAAAAKNEAAVAAALEAMLATGVVPQAEAPKMNLLLGSALANSGQHARAATVLERVVAAQPANLDAKLLLAEAHQEQGRPAEAIAMIQSAIAARSAAGQKPDESWYKNAFALAYNAKLPNALELSRQWVAAYPTARNWGDALRIYRKQAKLDDAATLDLLRLGRAAGSLSGNEAGELAFLAITRGYPGEAKAVLDEGLAAGTVDRNKSTFKDLIAEAERKSAGEAATLDSAARDGLAAASAKPALTTGDLLYGYGRFAKAAELYRAALGKAAADSSLINLRLGMALAQAGDKAGATAAFKAVTGPRAELAKYWLAYLASRS